MNNDNWYFGVGGLLGIIPAVITFFGSWAYCASEYGFLFGFGLGWLPSAILAGIVELAFILLWGPALAAVVYFVALPALKGDSERSENRLEAVVQSDFDEAIKQPPSELIEFEEGEPEDKDTRYPWERYSQMTDEELLLEAARQCRIFDYQHLSDQALRSALSECFAESETYATVDDIEAAADEAANDAIAAAESVR